MKNVRGAAAYYFTLLWLLLTVIDLKAISFAIAIVYYLIIFPFRPFGLRLLQNIKIVNRISYIFLNKMNQIRHIRLLQNNLVLFLERNVIIVRMCRVAGLTVRLRLKINLSLQYINN